jgi:uncharacterized membrane protein
VKPDPVAAMFLDGNTAEILNRNAIQYQMSLAALAGLGVIVSQVGNLEKGDKPFIFFALSVLYGLVGLLQVEQDRHIAILGNYRLNLERVLVRSQPAIKEGQAATKESQPAIKEGWEEYRARTSPNSLVVLFANSARYLLTLGISAAFSVAFYVAVNEDPDKHGSLKEVAIVIHTLLGVAVVALFVFLARATGRRETGDPDPQGTTPPLGGSAQQGAT